MKLKEGKDFYFNQAGLMVFTKEYHLNRGYCCESGCLNCPYDFKKERTMKRVAIIGANGKMGKIVQQSIEALNEYTIVAKVNRNDNLDEILKSTKPHIAIDVTSYESVAQNTWTIVKNGVHPIIGTSGLGQREINELYQFCKEKKLGAFIVPNFSLAFALINKISREFAQYYSDFSIVEFHHAQKKDKPSGTAKHTANIVGVNENEIVSVRSNGFLAKQQLYINSESERIVIDHESFSRNSFVKGIQLCIEKVLVSHGLVVGLENIVQGSLQ